MATYKDFRRLIEQHTSPEDQQRHRRSLAKLDEEPLTTFDLATICAYQHSHSLAVSIQNIPAEQIHQTLGRDFTYWLWLRAKSRRQRTPALEILTDGDHATKKLFEKARKSARKPNTSHIDPFLVRKAYQLITTLEGTIPQIDYEKLLLQYVKQGQHLSQKVLGRFEMRFLETERDETVGYAEGWDGQEDHSDKGKRYPQDEEYFVGLAGPVGVGIFYKDLPQAVTSYCPEDLDTLLALQFQGQERRKKKPNGEILKDKIGKDITCGGAGILGLFHWIDFLIAYGMEVTKKQGYSRMGVLGAENEPMTHKLYQDRTVHLPLNVAEQILDQNAIEAGFTQAPHPSLPPTLKEDNWYKDVNPIQ